MTLIHLILIHKKISDLIHMKINAVGLYLESMQILVIKKKDILFDLLHLIFVHMILIRILFSRTEVSIVVVHRIPIQQDNQQNIMPSSTRLRPVQS